MAGLHAHGDFLTCWKSVLQWDYHFNLPWILSLMGFLLSCFIHCDPKRCHVFLVEGRWVLLVKTSTWLLISLILCLDQFFWNKPPSDPSLRSFWRVTPVSLHFLNVFLLRLYIYIYHQFSWYFVSSTNSCEISFFPTIWVNLGSIPTSTQICY